MGARKMRLKSIFLTAALIALFVAAPIVSNAWVIVQDIGANNELIDNNTDDMIDFAGRGGTDNTDIRFDLDGTGPVISSPTDATVEIAGTAILNTVTIATALTINEDFVIALNAADEEITINQTSVTGPGTTGLIVINDDRTGATADVLGEATMTFDTEGVYAIAAIDGAIAAEGGYHPATSGGADLGSTTFEFNDVFLNDAGKIQLGDDQDVTITHVADTGILMELDDSIAFGDAAVYIESDADSFLDLQADGGVRVVGTLSPKADDGTALGSVNLNWSDLFIADSGVVNFGDDQDIKLTHVADTGLQFELDDKFMFGDTAVYVHSDDDGYLDLVADTGIRLSGATVVTGALSTTTTLTGYRIITSAGSGRVLTTAELGGGIVLVTAAVEVSLPDLCDSATGAYVTIVQADASEKVEIGVTDTADDMFLDGVSLGANQEIDSAAAAKEDDYITLVCREANEWHQVDKVGTWVDGGGAD